ncbi:DUF4190 domain-containing protein [Streptosporangium lutulentum]
MGGPLRHRLSGWGTSGETSYGAASHGEEPRWEAPYGAASQGEGARPGGPYGGPSQPAPMGDPAYPSYPPQGGSPYQMPSSPGGPMYPGGMPYPAGPGGPPMRGQGGGLGTASLVLGIVSVLLLVACGIGLLTAVVGLILGIVAVVKHSNRGRAWAGIILSVLTMIIAAVFVGWLYNKVGDCVNLPTELQQRCIEDRFGVQITTPS